MDDFQRESLSHDPIHGYIPFISRPGSWPDEVVERQIIDHPWVQRMRYIHQLQTAWWVFPAAEHTRFQHVMGAMHLASRVVERFYDSLRQHCPDVPSRACVEGLMRMAALLHDVGHGPFGHFFDDHFLSDYGLTHELLGCAIIREQLGPLLRNVRRNPGGQLQEHERLDPEQVAFLITRPRGPDAEQPRWLLYLRSLFSGIYTVDNMDFVLRDAYMSGYSTRAFDLDRILHYSFFSERGLTIHSRGLPALVKFMTVRAELFRSIYFHRTVRAIDVSLAELFARSKRRLFPGNPLERLDEYQHFTEMSLLTDVGRWARSSDPELRELGKEWQAFLQRQVPWRMACERTLYYQAKDSETASIFSDKQFVEPAIRRALPPELRELKFRVDLPRHVHRPGTRGPASGQNFLYDSARGEIRELHDSELFRQIPVSYRICRIYVDDHAHDAELAKALDSLLAGQSEDTLTNM